MREKYWIYASAVMKKVASAQGPYYNQENRPESGCFAPIRIRNQINRFFVNMQMHMKICLVKVVNI